MIAAWKTQAATATLTLHHIVASPNTVEAAGHDYNTFGDESGDLMPLQRLLLQRITQVTPIIAVLMIVPFTFLVTLLILLLLFLQAVAFYSREDSFGLSAGTSSEYDDAILASVATFSREQLMTAMFRLRTSHWIRPSTFGKAFTENVPVALLLQRLVAVTVAVVLRGYRRIDRYDIMSCLLFCAARLC